MAPQPFNGAILNTIRTTTFKHYKRKERFETNNRGKGGEKVGIAIGVLIALILIGLLIFYLLRRRQNRSIRQAAAAPQIQPPQPQKQFPEEADETQTYSFYAPNATDAPTREASISQANHASSHIPESSSPMSPVTASSPASSPQTAPEPSITTDQERKESIIASPPASQAPPPIPPKVLPSPRLEAVELPSSPPKAELEAPERYELS